MREISKRVEKEIVELQKQVSFSGKCTYNDYDSFTFDLSKEGTTIKDLVSLLLPDEDLVFIINCEYEVEPDYDRFRIEDNITDYQESIYWNNDTIVRCFSNQDSIKNSIRLQQNGDNNLLGVTPYTVKYPTELSKFCSMLCDLRIAHNVRSNGKTIQLILYDDFNQQVEYYFELDGQKKYIREL
jgi:hypothetical protein